GHVPALAGMERLVVAALEEVLEGKDIRRFPVGAAALEVDRVHFRDEGLGEPVVGRDDGDALAAFREARDERVAVHAAAIGRAAGRWIGTEELAWAAVARTPGHAGIIPAQVARYASLLRHEAAAAGPPNGCPARLS